MMISNDLNDKSVIDKIIKELEKLSLENLKSILLDLQEELNLKLKEITFENNLLLILTSAELETPVFELKIKLFHNEKYIGYYSYITNMEFGFVDEYFCLK